VHMGQFSVTIYGATGSVLSDIQHRRHPHRTNPPDAGAAKITLVARPYHGVARGGAERFPETGH